MTSSSRIAADIPIYLPHIKRGYSQCKLVDTREAIVLLAVIFTYLKKSKEIT